MKIISYNVNGIRAAMRKGILDWIGQVSPDIICIQETKAHKEQVDLKQIEEAGYHHYWNSAEKKGYSGVAIWSKVKPKNVIYETFNESLDGEGRIIVAEFEDFAVISLYVPSGGNVQRIAFKMKFCFEFELYVQELQKKYPKLIICGDYNICHKPIDIHDPIRLKNVSGFLPVEREWLTEYMESCDLVDSFRAFNPDPENYTWWSYRAGSRDRNKGWRIDYHMVSKELFTQVTRSVILPAVKHSDHCPILLELDTASVTS